MIKAPGVAQREVSELFAFTIPTVPGGSLYDASGLEMTDRQKDIMAALSGCCDVAGLLRRVKPKVRLCARQHAAIMDLTLQDALSVKSEQHQGGNSTPG